MIYYSFEPARPQFQKDTVQIMYPDAIIVEKYPFDGWFLDTLNDNDTLIINDIYDLCNYGNKFDIEKYMSLYKKNINLLFEKSTSCDSSQIKKICEQCNITAEVILNIEIEAFNRRVHFDMNQKRSSMTAAGLRGKRIGGKKGKKLITKKSIDAKQKILELSKDFNGSMSDVELMKAITISRNTYYHYKNDLKEKNKKSHK